VSKNTDRLKVFAKLLLETFLASFVAAVLVVVIVLMLVGVGRTDCVALISSSPGALLRRLNAAASTRLAVGAAEHY
jgi:hypothetical protein